MQTVFKIIGIWLFSFSALSAQGVLDEYIQQGVDNNTVLKQKNIALEKAVYALKIANSYFAPNIALQGAYTSGEGGRNIAIPIGDLLNPVYTSLNQLTESSNFPQVDNVAQNFFPQNFYDAKVHTTLPILNTGLIYQKKISQQQVLLQEFEADLYQRELVKEIKVAYFNYLSAVESVKIYASALTRAEESQRVNESLLANGKGLPAYVLRSQSEIENTRAQKAEAERQVENAKLYFNFLLNRDSQDSIDAGLDVQATFQKLLIVLPENAAIENREELKQLRENIAISHNALKMSQLYWVPTLNGFLDLGAQAENMAFDAQSRYYLFGFQLEMPLFTGRRHLHQIKQARLDKQNSELMLDNSRRQINMSAQSSKNNLLTAYQNFRSAQKQQEAARSYQRLIEKGYQEGVNTFIEAIDARSQLTQAQLQVTINRYRVLAATAQYERETASYGLK